MKRQITLFALLLTTSLLFGQTTVYPDLSVGGPLGLSGFNMVSLEGEHIISLNGFDKSEYGVGAWIMKLDSSNRLSTENTFYPLWKDVNEACSIVFHDKILITVVSEFDCDIAREAGILFSRGDETVIIKGGRDFNNAICPLTTFGSQKGDDIYKIFLSSDENVSGYLVDFEKDTVINVSEDIPMSWDDGQANKFYQKGDTVFFLANNSPAACLISNLHDNILESNQEISSWVLRRKDKKLDLVAISGTNDVSIFNTELELDSLFELPFIPTAIKNQDKTVLFTLKFWNQVLDYALWSDSLEVGKVSTPSNYRIAGLEIRNDELAILGIQHYGTSRDLFTSPNTFFIQSGREIIKSPANDINFISMNYSSSPKLDCGESPGPFPDAKGYTLKDVECVVENNGTDTLKSFYLGVRFLSGGYFCRTFNYIWDTIYLSLPPGKKETVYYEELKFSCYWDMASKGCLYACAPNGELDFTPRNNSACSDFTLSSVDVNVLDVVISPNPVSDELNIELPDGGAEQLRIIDINGKVIFNGNKPIGSIKIDCSAWLPGLYLVKITREGKTWTEKVIR